MLSQIIYPVLRQLQLVSSFMLCSKKKLSVNTIVWLFMIGKSNEFEKKTSRQKRLQSIRRTTGMKFTYLDKVGHLLSQVGLQLSQVGPYLKKVRSYMNQVGSIWRKSDPVPIGSYPAWIRFDHTRIKLHPIRRKLGQIWRMSNPAWIKLAPIWRKSDSIRRKS